MGGGENLQLPWKMEIFRGDLGACILNLTPCLQLVLACRLPLSLFEDAYTICGWDKREGGGGQLENITSIFNYFILFKILIFYNMGQAPFSSKEMPSKFIANCYDFVIIWKLKINCMHLQFSCNFGLGLLQFIACRDQWMYAVNAIGAVLQKCYQQLHASAISNVFLFAVCCFALHAGTNQYLHQVQ